MYRVRQPLQPSAVGFCMCRVPPEGQFSTPLLFSYPVTRRQGMPVITTGDSRAFLPLHPYFAGEAMLSHTELGGRYVIRCAIGGTHTQGRHVEAAWHTCQRCAATLLAAEPGTADSME